MKSIVIASNSSSGGKTTVTLGLMSLLKKKGFCVQGYKVGPDYIDAAFHSSITGKPSRNLDLFLMGEKGVKASFSRGTGDYGIVEGVMGLYDGNGIDTACSTAHVARTLDLPIVLVITPKAQVTTLCAEINGLVDFENVNIVGVILNNVSEGYFKLLKAAIEKNCRVEVFGYLPQNDRLKLKSRHLGLVQSCELENLQEFADFCAELLERHVNIERLLNYCASSALYEDEFHMKPLGIKIGIARDEAFNFYYQENLELLCELGEVKYFSPLRDEKLPEEIDFLYIGGGYPEVYAKELSKNISMRRNLKQKLEHGLNCYAECGGLMYLTEKIEEQEMVGFLSGQAYMTRRLQNFGYGAISISHTNKKLPQGLTINSHEFHTSYVDCTEPKIYNITKTQYNGDTKTCEGGYLKSNTLAAYPHIHFFGNLNFLEQLIKSIKIKG